MFATTVKCFKCSDRLTDGVNCSLCRHDFHFHCGQITEVGYNRLGERKLKWRCPDCKSKTLSPLPTPDAVIPDDSNEAQQQLGQSSSVTIDRELAIHRMESMLNSIEDKLLPMKTLAEDIKIMKSELSALNNTYKTVADNVVKVTERVVNIEETISFDDQFKRMNNVELKGVPQTNSENLLNIMCSLGDIINYPISKSQLNFVTRVQTRDPKHVKPIIACFLNRYVKEDFIAAYRAKVKESPIMPVMLGLQGNMKIYVNDHLTIHNKNLLSNAKTLAKEMGFQYVWVKHCRIHVRVNDLSPIHLISTERDLLKLQMKYK